MAPRQYNQNVSPTAVGYGCNASLGSASSSSTSSSSTSNSSSSSPIHGSPRGFHLHPTQHTTTTPAHEQHRGPRNNESNNNNENNLPSPVQSDPAWPHRLLSVLRRACQNQKLRYGTAAGIILAAIACALRTRPIGTGTGTGTLQEQRQRQRRWRLVVSMVARLGALLGASASASISILPASANPRKQAATAAATTTATTTTTTTTTTTNNNNNYLALAQFCNSLCATLVRWLKSPDYAHANSASLGWLKTAAERGLVQRALIGATDIVVRTTTDGWKTTALPPRSEGLKSDLVDLLTKGGCQEISKLPDTFWEKAATPLLTALPFLYLAVAYRMLRGLQNGNLNGDGGDFFSSKLLSKRGTSSFGDGARLTFKDVAGLDTILPEVREIVAYLRNPSGFHALGAEPPHGILLHGSPGLGKTMIAKAIAGEANCDAFCVCSGSDFCEMYVGRGAGRVRTLFREARRTALRNYGAREGRRLLPWPWPFGSTSTSNGNSSNGNGNSNNYDDKMEGDRARCLRPPTAIIFIDELDAVAKSRSYGGIANGNDERDQTLNQLLTEMDGFFRTNTTTTHRCNSTDENRVNIIVIAATNRAELLDPAILRRFDRHIRVPYPDKKGRADILKVHAIKTHCRFSTIHWEYLAEETRNFSGSDLKQVVNDAALLAVRQNSKHIEQGHLLQAIQRARATKVQNGNANAGRGTGYLPSSSMLPFVYR